MLRKQFADLSKNVKIEYFRQLRALHELEFGTGFGKITWMFGMSSSSPNTKTAGASSACLMSSTAAAPLAFLASNTNCSSGFWLTLVRSTMAIERRSSKG